MRDAIVFARPRDKAEPIDDDVGGALVPAAGKLAESGEALEELSELKDWALDVMGTVRLSTWFWIWFDEATFDSGSAAGISLGSSSGIASGVGSGRPLATATN